MIFLSLKDCFLYLSISNEILFTKKIFLMNKTEMQGEKKSQ